MELNGPQKEAVVTTEGPVLVLAGAGAGKTRTIVERIAHLIDSGAAPHSILAITFTNKAAKEMTERVLVRLGSTGAGQPLTTTFHALSARILREHAAYFDMPRHFTIYDRADSVRAVKSALKELGEEGAFEPRNILGSISRAKGEGFTLATYREHASGSYYYDLVARAWEKYQATLRAEKAFDFDDLLLYTKLLLENNRAVRKSYQDRWRYVHVDEYQDTNKVQYEIMRFIAEGHQNVFCVGDLDQCTPAQTQVTRADGIPVPIHTCAVGDSVATNYGSGDIRPGRVLSVHKKPYQGQTVRVTLTSGRALETTPAHIHFAGYKTGTSPQVHFTYLMYKKGLGYRIGVSQVYTKGQKRPVLGFVQRCNHEHADAVWILETHASERDARVSEYTLSLAYQIPTIPFVARKGMSTGGYVHDQELIHTVFASFDTTASAERLLDFYGLSQAYPHHRPQVTRSTRRAIVLTLCGDRRGLFPMHRISMLGSDPEGAALLREAGYSVRPAKKDGGTWRFETCRADYGSVLEIALHIQGLFPGSAVVEKARILSPNVDTHAGTSLPVLPAAALRRGMVMCVEDGSIDTIETVEILAQKKETTLYDLDIARTHNYIANGVVTHNSIYTWRGATIENILKFEKEYPTARTIKLEENYRSTKTIVAVSNDIIKKNKRRKEKTLYTKNADGAKLGLYQGYDESDEARFVAAKARELIKGGVAPERIAVLYRANFQSRVLEDAFITADVPYRVLGTRFFDRKEVKDVLSYLRAAMNPEHESDIRRTINTPARGIGKVTVDKLFGGEMETLPPKTKEKVDSFYALLFSIRAYAEGHTVADTLAHIIRAAGFDALYGSQTEEDLERLGNVKELVSLAQTKYGHLEGFASVEAFLEDAALATDQDEMEQSPRGVTLMTVHASKGLEFAHVFITGLEERLFPQHRTASAQSGNVDDEEERRLFYVALTRAEEQVHLTYAAMRTVFGQRNPTLPSEFILDIGEDYIEPSETTTPREKVVYLE